MPPDVEMTPQLPAKCARGAQPSNRNAEKHGAHRARRNFRELTRRLNDRRTREFREWMERRAVYLPHLGGEDSLSAMEARTLDELVRAEMRVDWLTAWLDAHQLVYGRGRHAQVVPVLRDHKGQTELARQLRLDLGLKRRAKDVGSLADYLREKAASVAPVLAEVDKLLAHPTAPPAPAVAATVPTALPPPADAASAPVGSEASE